MADHIPLDYEPRRPRERFLAPAMKLGLAILLVALGLVGLSLWTRVSYARHWPGRMCSKNLRQVGLAIHMYAADYRGVFPDSLETACLVEGLGTDAVICPSGPDDTARGPTTQQSVASIHGGGHCSYIYVGANLTTTSPASAIAAFEFPSNHGMDGGNILYADGHVEFVTLDKLVQLVPALEAGQNPPKFVTLTQVQAKTLYAQRWLPQLTAMQSGRWEKRVTNQSTTRPAPAIDAAVP